MTSRRSVRLATPADLDDVLALIHGAASWLHSRGIDQWPHESPTLSAEVIRGHIVAGHTWIAHEDCRPVATIALDADGDADFWTPLQLEVPAWYASKLAASREAPRGTGAMLLRWAVDKAWREHMTVVRLDVWRTNTELQDYYRRQGWSPMGVVERAWRKSGALFEYPAMPDAEARAYWEPEASLDQVPAWLRRIIRKPLGERTAVVLPDGGEGTVEAAVYADGSQPEQGAMPEAPVNVYWVRTGSGVEIRGDTDLATTPGGRKRALGACG